MEKAADNGQMKYLGTSDLNMRCLKLLFEWATVSLLLLLLLICLVLFFSG